MIMSTTTLDFLESCHDTHDNYAFQTYGILFLNGHFLKGRMDQGGSSPREVSAGNISLSHMIVVINKFRCLSQTPAVSHARPCAPNYPA